ncbi:hypothetical protein N8T08_010377 [Aspergillus melleus]|uniref:Uncharacterized protein n=1 Tax=Aspergillus melleus TaxID=138277 RepID=A0ACC3AS97_9EURO|nr:hypothetical protein N8T08_010377 [Aspergillus melleus]
MTSAGQEPYGNDARALNSDQVVPNDAGEEATRSLQVTVDLESLQVQGERTLQEGGFRSARGPLICGAMCSHPDASMCTLRPSHCCPLVAKLRDPHIVRTRGRRGGWEMLYW